MRNSTFSSFEAANRLYVYEVTAWRFDEEHDEIQPLHEDNLKQDGIIPDGWGLYRRPVGGGTCRHIQDYRHRRQAMAGARIRARRSGGRLPRTE